ncbi:MAG TPA: hypothetical protein VMH04_24285 [Candidatus Solibacter sp.]|nr:hypothetical protein [Candidatus Solibacter sp.]
MRNADGDKDRGQESTRNTGFRGSDDAHLDQALDAALARYAAVEPRAGLEDRILANLRAQPTEAAPRFWWRWGLAGGLPWAVAALLVVAAAIAWRSSRPAPPIAHRPAVEAPAPKHPEYQVLVHNDATAIHPHRRNALASQSGHSATVAAVPKLDVFPSPQPLTEQEKLVLGYVNKNPEQAALLAEAHMESLRREAEERTRLAAEDRNSTQ